MGELQNAGRMLEAAGAAAAADDLARADELLRTVARIQEAELGPLHPDLANTLNNLAVVAEKTGRLGDAETFYRRAVAIASASLPVEHPMIATSRENLEEFCRARGLPIDLPVLTAPAAQGTAARVDASASASVDTDQQYPQGSRSVSRSITRAAIGVVVVLLIGTFLVTRPWSSRRTPTPAPTAQPTAQAAVDRALSTVEPARPAPIEQARPPAVADSPPSPSRSSGSMTLATVQLCRTLSTSGASWGCDPAVDPVSPGSIILYTRVRSPRDAVVEHRWFRGDTLVKSSRLTIRASATEGYRTYSRQIVDGGADWRVEVRSADGAVLHEQRFVVR